MYFVFNILILILIKTFISVGSNTTTTSKGMDEQNASTTSRDTFNAIQDNDSIDLAADTTLWFSQRLVTEEPALYVTQRKTPLFDVDSTERYTQVSLAHFVRINKHTLIV